MSNAKDGLSGIMDQVNNDLHYHSEVKYFIWWEGNRTYHSIEGP